MRTLSRRERERQEHVNYILDVAEKLFADQGFFKVTMAQLAQKAEFALGTIYSLFKGKRELYDQLIHRNMKEFVPFVSDEMARETAPQQVVEKFIEAKLTFLYRNLDFVRLYFVEAHTPWVRGKQALAESLQQRYAPLIEKLTGAIAQGIREGIFARADPGTLTTAIDGLTTGFALSWIGTVTESSPRAEIAVAKQIFFQGALARR